MASVTPESVRAWIRDSRDRLALAREQIDALNVFPVPDGDTGTNMWLTMQAAWEGVEGAFRHSAPVELEPVVGAAAQGALLGARGNSGVILSQILRGIGQSLANAPVVDGSALAEALRTGADQAYRAVARPVEGTILTVIRSAADAAEAAVEAGMDEIAGVLEAAQLAASDAVRRSPTMLETLRLAGVVDAGGQGLVVVLDAWLGVLREAPQVHNTIVFEPGVVVDTASANASIDTGEYEVMYLFEGSDVSASALRAALDELGNSVVVVGGEPLWNVHVHTPDAGAAVESGLAIGRPHRIAINYLGSARRHEVVQRGVVFVTHGSGIASLVSHAGGTPIPTRPREVPSAGDLLTRIQELDAREVVILPSDGDGIAVADSVAAMFKGTDTKVAVVPTRSVVQSLAALAVHDGERDLEQDLIAMTRAAEATAYGGVTVAVKDALTMAGPCAVGDIIAVMNGEIVMVNQDMVEAVCAVVEEAMTAESSLLTLVAGADAHAELTSEIIARVEDKHPAVELIMIDGGQPLWPYIIGVE